MGEPSFLENIQHLSFTATQYCYSSGLSVFTSNTQTACLLSLFYLCITLFMHYFTKGPSWIKKT